MSNQTNASKENKKVFVYPGLNSDNSRFKPVVSKGFDFSNGTVEHFHLERDGNGLKSVSDGFVDHKKMIQSEANNAGLSNLIRLQTLRYGTIENAIARNADKQLFADVSNIPTSVAEQAEYIANVEADVAKLCAELGVSKEDLLKSNQETLARMVEAKKQASVNSNDEGGNK